MRWTALAVVVVMAAYHAMRITASQCTGGGCDIYIPFSLALPLAAIVLVGITGVIGFGAAHASTGWRAGIATAAALGVLGPPVALAIWRDAPDVLVPVATVLILLCPVCVLGYGISRRRPA